MEDIVQEFKFIADMKAYLIEQSGGTSAAEPIQLKLSGVDLSSVNVYKLFAAVSEAGKYVAFDLSACTGPTVWERYKDKGTDRVVSLALPDTVTEIAMDAFAATFASLKTLKANGAETVGCYAFSRYRMLAEIDLPQATSVGDYAFSGCTALTKIKLPQVTSIGDGAFWGCTALDKIDLPQTTNVGDEAFWGCTALDKIDLPQTTNVGDEAFCGCTALAKVTLPKATNIGDKAFYNCTVLAEVDLPEATNVGDRAFCGCTALAKVTLPKATSIGDYAFSNCNKLAEVNLPEATNVGARAFCCCYALAEINLPQATNIGDQALACCHSLESLVLGTEPPTFGSEVFYDAGKDTESGFTIFVPDKAAKERLKAEINNPYSNWLAATGNAKFKGVEVRS